MRDQEHQPPQNAPAPFSSLPDLPGERRKEQDRRSLERGGKYDRRRNRCGHCLHFQLKPSEEAGLCQFHQITVSVETFACPQFDSQPAEEVR